MLDGRKIYLKEVSHCFLIHTLLSSIRTLKDTYSLRFRAKRETTTTTRVGWDQSDLTEVDVPSKTPMGEAEPEVVAGTITAAVVGRVLALLTVVVEVTEVHAEARKILQTKVTTAPTRAETATPKLRALSRSVT